MIWYLKLHLKDRVKDNGEVTFVNDHLLMVSAQSCRCMYPEHCLTIEERREKPSAVAFPEYDVSSEDVLLLGPSNKRGLTEEQELCVIQQLPGLLRVEGESRKWYRDRGWPAIHDFVMHRMHKKNRFMLDKYMQASLPSMDVVTCNDDCRHVVTDNRWVFVGYTYDDNTECPCVAQVQAFVRVRTSNGASKAFDPRGCVHREEVDQYIVPSDIPGKSIPAQPLRMAICKLWAADILDCDAIGSPDRQPGSVPDLLKVHHMGDTEANQLAPSARRRSGTRCYFGLNLVNLSEVWSQLVPSQTFQNDLARGGTRESQVFMTCSKLSGK